MKSKQGISVKSCFEVVGTIVTIWLLGCLLYQVSTPSTVNQTMLEDLQRTVTSIANYTSRMTILTELSRQQVRESDLKYARDEIDIIEDYDDLSAQYGISKHESYKINRIRTS